MKSIDIDAQNMIRSYIDSIEEYLRKHTRLHPNEIDSLLNEINDFIYLRSGEIATDPEERVHYADVLKAIEECGSPSEICEQYLDQMTGEDGELSAQDLTPKKIKEKATLEPSKPKKGRFKSPIDFSKKAKSIYRSSKGFYVYRIGFILLSAYFLIFFTFYNFIEHTSRYYFEEPSLFIEVWSAQYLSTNFCAMLTFLAFIFVIWEGLAIRKWKQNLRIELGIDHSFDDSLITWVSRLFFLVGFLKASLLFVPVYIWYTPIWLVLMIIFERQVESPLWRNQIAPWLTSIGKQLASDADTMSSGRVFSIWSRNRPHFKRRETLFTFFLFGVFIATFGFPIVFLSFVQMGEPYGYFEGYALESALISIPVYSIFSIVAILLPLLVSGFEKVKNKPFINSPTYYFFYGDSGIIIWLIRLLILKTILLITSYVAAYRSMYFFAGILVILLVASEILFDTYGGNSARIGLATLFVRLGSSEPLFQSSRDVSTGYKDNSVLSVSKPTSRISTETQPSLSMAVAPGQLVEEKPTAVREVEYEAKPSLFTRAGSKIAVTFGKGLLTVLTGFFLLFRILFVTLGMLLISFYEVGLAFVVLITSPSSNGSYTVPLFKFKDLWFYYDASVSTYTFGGFTIWAWHAILLLGLQIFAVSAIQFSGLLLRRPEGIIAKVGKNLSRVFLFVLLLSSLVQLTVFGDSYALIRLAIVFALIVFNELTSWKTREGRKQWEVTLLDKQLAPINKDEHSKANEIITQS